MRLAEDNKAGRQCAGVPTKAWLITLASMQIHLEGKGQNATLCHIWEVHFVYGGHKLFLIFHISRGFLGLCDYKQSVHIWCISV